MTGIFFFAVLALWFGAAIKLTAILSGRLPDRLWRPAAAGAIFVAILILPIIDEIIGGFQFRALCARNADFRIAVQDIGGRVTRVEFRPSNEVVPGKLLTIYRTRVNYIDVNSSEPVLQYEEYVVKGGIIVRLLGISENNSPLTVGAPVCWPGEASGRSAHILFKFKVVN